MMIYNKYFLFLMLLCIGGHTHAQNLLDELDKNYSNTPQHKIATFKSSRILIGHTTETLKKGVLEIGYRARLWNGPYEDSQSFIADKWSNRFSVEYGINNRLTYGFGATAPDGIFDHFIKYKMVRQVKNGFPLNITILQSGSYNSKGSTASDVHQGDTFGNRLAFTSQLLVSSKINSLFSLQLAPTFVHRASSNFEEDPNNHFALGIGARYKISGHISIASEYYYLANPLKSRDTYNAFSIGLNWEASDVMLQFQMTNTRTAVEDTFITQTPNNFNFRRGNFVFGLTGIYVFHLHNELKRNR